jgi:3-ketoacyl-CoA synthase
VLHVTEALQINLRKLGILVLPYSEQFKYLISLFRRKFLKQPIKQYIPDFKKAFHHYCIHAGGRAILDAMEQHLSLKKQHILPSRATLWCFGNTSSASIWYELAFIERHMAVHQGENVWQIAFGSGVSCNSAVWTALRSIHDTRRAVWKVDALLEELDRAKDEKQKS